jgi:hypothetical protein
VARRQAGLEPQDPDFWDGAAEGLRGREAHAKERKLTNAMGEHMAHVEG